MAKLTRREVLTAFLGLPVALASCRTSSRNIVLPAGEIVGASDRLGHRVRDHSNISVPPDQWRSARVVIVGGGAAGLAAAWRLQQAGVADFELLELESAPGGTARSGTSALVDYPWGAHYLPLPLKENVDLVALLSEMGVLEGSDQHGEPVAAEQYLCRDPEERVFYKGRWYEGLYLSAGATAEDKRQLDLFNQEVRRLVAWRGVDGKRAFTIPVANCSDDDEIGQLDQLSFGDWFRQHGLDSTRLLWLANYACRDDYGATLDQTSAWAGFFYFCSRVNRPDVESQPLLTWPEGNGRLIKHLYTRVHEHVRLGQMVTELIPTAAGVDVITLDPANRAAGIHADRVIFAAPQFLTRYIIRPYRERAPAHLDSFQYGSWMVANLHLRQRPEASSAYKGFPLAWDNVIYDSPALGYVCATHQRGLDRGPTVFTYYYPLTDADTKAARQRLLSTDWRGWADVTLADLERAHPEIRQVTERLDVMRWGHAMVRPNVGFVRSKARLAAAQPFGNIHFANTDLSAVPLFEEAFYHGLRAANEVMGAGLLGA